MGNMLIFIVLDVTEVKLYSLSELRTTHFEINTIITTSIELFLLTQVFKTSA